MNNNKQPYESPQLEMVEIKAEGLVCASSTPQWNSPFNPEQNW